MNDSRRAVARWAWRLLRRDWRQQLLTTLLLVLAVAAAVTGSAMAVGSQHDSSGLFGDGDALIRLSAGDPAVVQAALAEATEAFGVVEPIWHTPVRVPGTNELVDVRGQVPGGPLASDKLRLLDGRYPEAPGEAALTTRAAELFRAGIGDTIDLDGAPATVVGSVEDPTSLDDDFVLVLPDETAPAEFLEILTVVGPDGSAALGEDGVPGQEAFLSRAAESHGTTAVIVIIANTLVLALVGLIAAAGFVVIAQRRQRQLGLLAAIGGSPRDLRLVMVANGLVVGIIAASLGTVGGIVGWQLARPATEEAGGRRLDALELPWSLVALTAVLAVVVATLAAWWPARHVSRLPIMASLSGRPARPRPVHRSVLLALAVMAGGVVLVVLGIPDAGDANGIVLSLGLVAVVIGVVLIAPAAVRLLGAVARRMPFAPRLALRDLSRYQSRSAASVASITLGLGIAVSVIAVAAANVVPDSEGNLGPNQLLVEPVDMGAVFDGDATTAEAQQFDAQAATVIAAVGDATAVPLDVAVNVAGGGSNPQPVVVGEPVPGERAVEVITFPYVATPEVLAHFGIDPATIDPEADLLIAEDRDVLLVDPALPLDPDAPEPVLQVVDLPEYFAAPYALVTEAAIDRHGWDQVRMAWFAESPQRITGDVRDAARTAAEGAGLSITTRDDQDDLAAIRRWSTVGGVGLALAIVAMAVGMMRGEAARDVRTLTATGATSRTRRALTASTAGALATLGAVLGVSGAYVFLVAAYRSDLGHLSPLPVGNLLTVVVGLPVLATAAGWLLAGREPRGFARQALD